jgi:malonyl-CoA/methylmalonyl-CoA synthetase
MGNLYLTYREGFPQDLKSPFLEYPDGSLITYEELEEQSSQYANGFSDLGLQPGDRVSVQVDKSPEVIFIYLACLRSNLIFHPLNTAYKESELSFFLDDAKPSVFICKKEIYENLPSLGLKKEPQYVYTQVPLEGESIQNIKRKGDHEIVDCSKEHTAALLYSSGTTGKPKGIMLTHGNIGSNALALKEAWNFTQED